MEKKQLRLIYKERRLSLTEIDYKQRINDLISNLKGFSSWPKFKNILSFKPIEKYREVDTAPIEDFFKDIYPNTSILYPRIEDDGCTMNAYLANAFSKNHLDILEPIGNNIIQPQDIDLIITPLLIFDEKGYRVGYGKGFYDEYFTRATNALKVGLCLFEPVPTISDRNDNDIKLDLCVTPLKLYNFMK